MTLADYPIVVVVWHQPGCGHCEEFIPVARDVAARYPHVPTLLVDATRNERLADAFAISATPTVTMIQRGRTVARSDAALDADKLSAMYERGG